MQSASIPVVFVPHCPGMQRHLHHQCTCRLARERSIALAWGHVHVAYTIWHHHWLVSCTFAHSHILALLPANLVAAALSTRPWMASTDRDVLLHSPTLWHHVYNPTISPTQVNYRDFSAAHMSACALARACTHGAYSHTCTGVRACARLRSCTSVCVCVYPHQCVTYISVVALLAPDVCLLPLLPLCAFLSVGSA